MAVQTVCKARTESGRKESMAKKFHGKVCLPPTPNFHVVPSNCSDLRDRKNHDSQRRDRILRFFLSPVIGQFSPHFGAISLLNYKLRGGEGGNSKGGKGGSNSRSSWTSPVFLLEVSSSSLLLLLLSSCLLLLLFFFFLCLFFLFFFLFLLFFFS